MYGLQGSVTVRKSLYERIPKSELWSVPFVLSGAALLIQSVLVPSLTQSVQVDFSGWNWLSQIQFQTEKADSSIVQEWDIKVSKPKEVKVRKVHFATRKKQIYSKGFSKGKVLGKVPTDDHLTVSAAAPVMSEPGHSNLVDTMEKKKLLLVHRLLSARLIIALNSPSVVVPTIAVATQSLEPVVLPPAPTKSEVLSSQNKHERKKVNRGLAAIARPTIEPAAASPEIAVEHQLKIASSASWNQTTIEIEDLADDRRLSWNSKRSRLERNDSELELTQVGATLNELLFEVVGDHIRGLQGANTGENIPSKGSLELHSLLAAASNLNEKPSLPHESARVTYSPFIANDYSSEYSKSISMNTHLNTQQKEDLAPNEVAVANTERKLLKDERVTEGVENQPIDEKFYIEALASRVLPVFGVDNEVISSEPTQKKGQRLGWQLAAAKEHWSTLYWNDLEMKGNNFIPLFHQNTIRSFSNSSLGGMAQQAGAGIVFGKVAAGWQVEMGSSDVLGNSDPIYFDAQSQIVPSEQIESERTFVLLNVNPGSRVLYLRSKAGNLSGGITIPVLAGTSTYVHATEIRADREISGTLYDETENSDEPAWPLAGSTVRLIGQASAVSITDTNGIFQLKNVVYAGSYPHSLESYKVLEDENGTLKYLGFTHRYQVAAKDLADLKLFRISRKQIKEWIHQIPAGMSHDSGLSVVAFTHMDEVDSAFKLIPNHFSLNSSAAMTPVTSLISENGYLTDSSILQSKENRALGAQLSEGPVVFQLSEDHRTGKVVWSILMHSSPGVVNTAVISLREILNNP